MLRMGPGVRCAKHCSLQAFRTFSYHNLTDFWQLDPSPREEHPRVIPNVSIVLSFHLALFQHPVPAKVDTEMDHVEVQPQHGARAHDLAHGIGPLILMLRMGPGVRCAKHCSLQAFLTFSYHNLTDFWQLDPYLVKNTHGQYPMLVWFYLSTWLSSNTLFRQKLTRKWTM